MNARARQYETASRRVSCLCRLKPCVMPRWDLPLFFKDCLANECSEVSSTKQQNETIRSVVSPLRGPCHQQVQIDRIQSLSRHLFLSRQWLRDRKCDTRLGVYFQLPRPPPIYSRGAISQAKRLLFMVFRKPMRAGVYPPHQTDLILSALQWKIGP